MKHSQDRMRETRLEWFRESGVSMEPKGRTQELLELAVVHWKASSKPESWEAQQPMESKLNASLIKSTLAWKVHVMKVDSKISCGVTIPAIVQIDR